MLKLIRNPLFSIGIIIFTIMFWCTFYTFRLAFTGESTMDNHQSMFPLPNATNNYDDLLRVSMANWDITHGCSEGFNAPYKYWPSLFQNYLIANPYLVMWKQYGVDNALTQLPPLSLEYTRIIARSVVIFGPEQTLWGAVGFNVLALLACCGFFITKLNMPINNMLSFGVLCMVSMPALFVIQRGHSIAFMTIMLCSVYAFTKITGRCWWIGVVCLAFAINFRPNVATFLLLELYPVQSIRKAAGRVVVISALSCNIAFIFYSIVNYEWPQYTIHEFLNGLHAYKEACIIGDASLPYQVCLQLTAKLIRQMLELQPLYNPFISSFISILGGFLSVFSIINVLKNKLAPQVAIFICCAITSLFCPAFCYYHSLIFAIPLTAVIIKMHNGDIYFSDIIVYICCIAALIAYPGWMVIGVVVPIIILIGLVVILIAPYVKFGGGEILVSPESVKK